MLLRESGIDLDNWKQEMGAQVQRGGEGGEGGAMPAASRRGHTIPDERGGRAAERVTQQEGYRREPSWYGRSMGVESIPRCLVVIRHCRPSPPVKRNPTLSPSPSPPCRARRVT